MRNGLMELLRPQWIAASASSSHLGELEHYGGSLSVSSSHWGELEPCGGSEPRTQKSYAQASNSGVELALG